MRIVGDVHGKMDEYIAIAKASPDGYSVNELEFFDIQ